jgi:hypothetical protein
VDTSSLSAERRETKGREAPAYAYRLSGDKVDYAPSTAFVGIVRLLVARSTNSHARSQSA